MIILYSLFVVLHSIQLLLIIVHKIPLHLHCLVQVCMYK